MELVNEIIVTMRILRRPQCFWKIHETSISVCVCMYACMYVYTLRERGVWVGFIVLIYLLFNTLHCRVRYHKS